MSLWLLVVLTNSAIVFYPEHEPRWRYACRYHAWFRNVRIVIPTIWPHTAVGLPSRWTNLHLIFRVSDQLLHQLLLDKSTVSHVVDECDLHNSLHILRPFFSLSATSAAMPRSPKYCYRSLISDNWSWCVMAANVVLTALTIHNHEIDGFSVGSKLLELSYSPFFTGSVLLPPR